VHDARVPPLSFNIAGPCIPGEHYMLPPGDRVVRAMELVEHRKFFSLVAGHQCGKTTCLRWMAAHYNAGDRLRALWIDLQVARDTPDPAVALPRILRMCEESLRLQIRDVVGPSPEEIDVLLRIPGNALLDYLRALAAASPLPLVVFFDEADGLVGATMVSFLSQLRAGYLSRTEAPFPQSVALVGRRAVRDDTLSLDERRQIEWLGSSSPFNVNAEVTSVALFTRPEVESLLAQHTTATGQRFEADAVSHVFALTEGQPWLVNALADYATDRLVRDRALAVTRDHIEAAKEALILERRTHIDALVARLREPRVRRVIDPMLSGELLPFSDIDDDLLYVAGLGLIRKVGGEWIIANAMYREVVPRALTAAAQSSLYQRTEWYVRPDGLLDVPKLMAAWQEFWREDGRVAAEGFGYKESGPHLLMMAFLQRIVNGGGRIDREYALGKGALDLLITWKTQRIAVELKLWRRPTTEPKGIAQLAGYLDTLGLDEGWLVIFETRPAIEWEARSFARTEAVGGRTIHVVGC
jgi:hypothetical protein